MKRTYVMVDGEFVERKRDNKGRWHFVQPDIKPYKSMIDGRMITSRSEHRAHLKAHGCVEIGNEDPTKAARRPPTRDTRTERIAYEVNKRFTNDQADRLLRQLRADLNHRR